MGHDGKREIGWDGGGSEHTTVVVAEFKAPPSVEGKPPVAAKNDNIHPFWAITRLEKKDDEHNYILQSEHTTVVVGRIR